MAQKKPPKLPENVERDRQVFNGKEVIYYRYIFPDGRRKSLGSDLDKVIKSALILNERTRAIREERKTQALIQRATNPMGERNPPFTVVAEAYKDKRLGRLSKTTAAQRRRDIDKMKKWFGSMPIRKIEPFDLTRRFEDIDSPHRLAQFRFLAIDIWRFAISRGKCDMNIAEVTDTPSQVFTSEERSRQRKRHTWHGFQRILDSSEEWLAFASLLALYSTQRRSDLVTMQWDKVDMRGRTLEVRQKKTGVWLKIQMGDELYNVLKWFHDKEWSDQPTVGSTGRTRWTADTPCPYVIHRKPQRRNKALTDAVRRGDMHWYQVTPSTFTHEFCDARNNSGAYEHLPPRQRPSLHDVRALGLFLLHQAGYSIEYIQALAGHAGAAMTHHYLEGHEAARPVEVQAGLSVAKLNMDEIDWDNVALPPALQEIADERDE